MILVVVKDEADLIEGFMAELPIRGQEWHIFYTSQPYTARNGRELTAGDALVFIGGWSDGEYASDVFDAVAPLVQGS